MIAIENFEARFGWKTKGEKTIPLHYDLYRIVSNVDVLMEVNDTLELQLIARAAVQERFARAVGKMVGGLLLHP